MIFEFVAGLVGGLAAIYSVLAILLNLRCRRARFYFAPFQLIPAIPEISLQLLKFSWRISFESHPEKRYSLSIKDAVISTMSDSRILIIENIAAMNGVPPSPAIVLLSFGNDGSLACTCSALGTSDRLNLGRFGVRESLPSDRLEILLEHHQLLLDEAVQTGAKFRELPTKTKVLEELLNAFATETFASAQAHGDFVPTQCPALGFPVGHKSAVFRFGSGFRSQLVRREISDLLRIFAQSSLPLRIRTEKGDVRRALRQELRFLPVMRSPSKKTTPRVSRSYRLKVLALSAIAFLLVYPGTWNYAFDIMMIVFFHELGHGLAMKWRGYRNISLGFVPGLGGFATGNKGNESIEDQLYVVLGGPIFGLVVSILIFLLLPQSYLHGKDGPVLGTSFYTFSFIINCLNLIPISPLDGGRAVELIFRGRTGVRLVRVFGLAGLIYLLPSISGFLGLLGSVSLFEYLTSKKVVIPEYPVARSSGAFRPIPRVSLEIQCRFLALYLSAFLLVILAILIFLLRIAGGPTQYIS